MAGGGGGGWAIVNDVDAFLFAGSAMVLGPALLVEGWHDFVSLLQSVLFLLCSLTDLLLATVHYSVVKSP